MKKIVLTVAVLLSTIISSNANEVKMIDRNLVMPAVEMMSITEVENADVKNDSTPGFYDMHLNEYMRGIRRSFLLDKTQEELLKDVQNGVEEGFARLDSMDTDRRLDYMNSIVKYWHNGAKTSFYASERTDAPMLFRRYWTCVNATLRNRGIINENGEFAVK